MTWRLVRALEILRQQVRAAAPAAVPPATPASAWGTVGDLAHQSGASDHNPATYAALGSTPVVCAADFPHAPGLGLDGARFAEALRLSRDPRIGYVIFKGRIFSGHVAAGTPAFTWRAYNGADDHSTHWHVSTVHTAAADNTALWAMPGSTTGADMSWNDIQKADAAFNNKPSATLDTDGTIDGKGSLREFPNATYAAIEALTERVKALEAQGPGAPAAGGVSEDRVREIAREELDNADIVPGD
jgi:hypothetical protein